MTSRERIAQLIERYWAEQWTSPTVRELADELGMSVSSVHWQLQRMVALGILECKRVSPRRVLYRAPHPPHTPAPTSRKETR